jgi:hypothetical protein
MNREEFKTDVGKICRRREAKGAVAKSGFLVEGLYAGHD